MSLPQVSAAAVVACERDETGTFLVAFVVMQTMVEPAEETTLKARLKHDLRRIGSVIPSVIRFVSSLPLSANGKTDLARLKLMAQEEQQLK